MQVPVYEAYNVFIWYEGLSVLPAPEVFHFINIDWTSSVTAQSYEVLPVYFFLL